MKKSLSVSLFTSLIVITACGQTSTQWKPHDRNRPAPPVIDPGVSSTQDTPGKAPSDAVVLFDGKDLSAWSTKSGEPAKWKVGNGYFEVVPKTGYIYTKQSFADCQLHVEFASPSPAEGQDQDRGNSGVFLMGVYEIQVLDSYNNKTYADGQAAAVYGQYPPLVNASRKPGEWQSYDIVFHPSKFDKDGKLVHLGRVTVFHNGVLVQDNVEIQGPTVTGEADKPHADKLPIALQDHNHPVRFRNIWLRELAASS